jgi:hypothetical protein
MRVILSHNGSNRRSVDVEEITVPDLWHLAMAQKRPEDQKAILEVWHLAHDLLDHIKTQENAGRKIRNLDADWQT